jgi:Contractile injection system tube protein
MILGELKKMKLTGYHKNTFGFSDKTGEEYTAVLNPETYSLNYEIRSNNEQAQGTSANQSNFSTIAPKKLEFDFLFDATGALTSHVIALPFSLDKQKSLDDQIRQFKRTIFDFIGKTHQPPFVLLQWGTLEFRCKVEKMLINYKLFKPDGTPLRAIAKVTFAEEVEDKHRAAEEAAASPDLTHIRTVHAGDTLPLLCHDIYQDATLYREIARVNRLINFRKLKVGQQIFFPPIQK